MPKSLIRVATKKLLIAINCVIALLYLLGCYGSFIYTSQFWMVGLCTLAVVYLFLLLVLFFIFWLLARSKWALLFIVLVAASWKPIQKLVPFRMGEAFVQQKKEGQLRIMSWNVAQFDIMTYKKDHSTHDNMIKLVNEFEPDIACFQEMVAGDSVVELNNAYYRRFSFYALEDFEFSMHFTNEYYTYNWKENYLNQQHFGIVIFSKYPIINRKDVALFPYDYNSIFQYVDIVKGEDTLRIFNIHLQSLKFTPNNLAYIDNPSFESREALKNSRNILSKMKRGFLRREQQANKIAAEIKKSPYPVIVCGDFNDVPNSYAYATIGKGLQNAFEKKGAGLGRTFSGIAPTLRIDNIFAAPAFRVEQMTRVAKKLSDHFPIIADFTYLGK